MKTLEQVKKHFGSVVPKWYTEAVHTSLIAVLVANGKLQGCKFLRDTSNSETSRDSLAQQLYLREAKDISDFIMDGTTKTSAESFAHDFAVWAWGKQIPSELTELEAFIVRYFNENNVTFAYAKTK